MINILFVFGDIFKRGGTETVMRSIYDHIDRGRFHIDFLLLSDDPDDTEFTKHIGECGGFVYHIVRRGKDYSRHKRELKRFFKEHKYDIVHTHMDAIGDEVLSEAKRAGIKVRVAHSHNTAQVTSHSLLGLLHGAVIGIERLRLRSYATCYVACSSEAGEWLFGEKRCKGDNYLLFRNAIDLDKFMFSRERYIKVRESLGIGEEAVVGHVGSFLYQKNHEFLLNVFADLAGKINARLVLVGTGALEESCREQAEKLGITDRVLFLGSRPDVCDLLQGMDVFAFPSRFEGFGVALLEAQASGLKCLASAEVPREADVTGNVVFLPAGSDTGIWVDELLRILKSDYQRVSPIEAVRDAGYDMSGNIRKLEEFYIRALEKVEEP